jgi:hypothetical protein
MLGLLSLAISLGAVWFGYGTARRFVRERLRYVDGALSGGAAIVAGLGAAIVAWPVAWLLPLISGGTAIAFGIAVGLGTRACASDVKHGYRLSDGR